MLHNQYDYTNPYSADKCVRPQFEDFLSSVVELENAMAKALQTQSETLLKIQDQVSADQLLEFNEKLESTIKYLLKKEMMLESLLVEFKDYCKRNQPCQCRKCRRAEKINKYKMAKVSGIKDKNI